MTSSARTLGIALGTVLGLLAFGCGSSSNSDGGDQPTVDCSKDTPAAFSTITAFDTCTTCHSSTLTGAARSGAPSGLDFDTFAVAKANASEAVSELEEGGMPPSGSPKPSAAEKQALYVWAECGTPE
jgi:hypothetical protein